MRICQIRIQNNLVKCQMSNLVISSDSIAKENSSKCTRTCLMGSEKVNVVYGLAAGGRKCRQFLCSGDFVLQLRN